MKYKHLVSLALAAALLAGCGGTESSAGSAAVGQSTGSVQNAESSQNTPALAAQKERITDQFALEKNALSVWGTVRCSTFPSMCPSWNALARTP